MAFLIAALLSLQDPPPAPLETAWSVELDDLVLGGPAVKGNLAIAASRKGKVTAINIDTGETAWTADVKGDVISNLVWFKNQLFVPSLRASHVLDPASGKILQDDGPPASRAIVGASRLYLLGGITFEGGYRMGASQDVVAYDPSTGRKLWKESFGPLGVAAAVESGNHVYVAGQYQISVVNAQTGKTAGQVSREKPRTPGVPFHGVADKERIIFLPEKPMCFHPKTLKETWGADVKGETRLIPPVLTPDYLVVFPLPDVVALSPATGDVIWTLALSGAADFSWKHPPILASKLYLAVPGKVFAVDVNEGRAVWSHDTGAFDSPAFVQQPVLAPNGLICTTGRRVTYFKLK